jgi:hypothetical protein
MVPIEYAGFQSGYRGGMLSSQKEIVSLQRIAL